MPPVLSYFSATKTNIYKTVLFLKLFLKFQINKTNAFSTKSIDHYSQLTYVEIKQS